MRKLTFASFKEVSLTGAGAIAVYRMYISRSLYACPACFEFWSSKMARRHDSSIFSLGKTHSRILTIFFSSNKRKSEYLHTVLEKIITVNQVAAERLYLYE